MHHWKHRLLIPRTNILNPLVKSKSRYVDISSVRTSSSATSLHGCLPWAKHKIIGQPSAPPVAEGNWPPVLKCAETGTRLSTLFSLPISGRNTYSTSSRQSTAAVMDVDSLKGNGWKLDENERGLEKTFHFKTWTKCLDFVNCVGIQCKVKNHHPTITLALGTVKVHWITHTSNDISEKDIDMAVYCDQRADEIGTLSNASSK